MHVFEKVGINIKGSIDWEITPALTFTIFESWGSRVRIRSLEERFYYFYIDTWQQPARICLMERGVKYARVLAEIDVPQEMIDRCVAEQGTTQGLDKSYAINEELKKWLLENVINPDDATKVRPVLSGLDVEDMDTQLPGPEDAHPEITPTFLASKSTIIAENNLPTLVKQNNFFDTNHNPSGRFKNYLVDNVDHLTVSDLATGLMWQRAGFDIATIRKMQNNITDLNRQSFAGYNDWRLPTLPEALSLMEPEINSKGLHLHPCFSKAQPFIFLAEQRQPGGYWFADFKQGTIFWASGFNPGGFGRLCRTI